MATTNEAPIDTGGADNNDLNDPWTPEQESALLKALVQYKPIGLHAHFRMISVRNYLLNSGTIDPDATHTRVPGIWAKLRTLYDIDQLDENEDAIFTSLGEEDNDQDTDGNEAPSSSSVRGNKRNKREETASSRSEATAAKKGYWRDFELPRGDDDDDGGAGFEELIWERRLNPEGTPDGSDWDTRSSRLLRTADKGEATTTTDEPRSSPAARGTRSGRKGRVNQLRDDMEVDSSPTPGRASRRLSKAASEAEEAADEDQVMEDAEEDEDEDDEEESEENEDEEEDKRGATTRRGRGGGRGRGVRRGRRRK